eukprot:c8311_g1_i1 orf=38-256(-)
MNSIKEKLLQANENMKHQISQEQPSTADLHLFLAYQKREQQFPPSPTCSTQSSQLPSPCIYHTQPGCTYIYT